MFTFGESRWSVNMNDFYCFCNFSVSLQLFQNKFKRNLYHTMPYFLLLKQQNYLYFLCACDSIWGMGRFETSFLKGPPKSASISQYYGHYMFAMFIVNCLQELGVYNFWTVKDLIQAEESEKPRGKIERKKKHI